MRLLLVVAGVFFLATPAFAGGPPVPEPNTLTMLVIAVLGAVLVRRWRRGR